MDAIDDIFFERNVSGNSSDVTLTKEESFAEPQKKGEQKNSTWISETEEEEVVQNKQNSNMQTKGIQAVVL